MLDMIETDLMMHFFIILILMSVASGLYYEMDTLIRFITKTAGKSGFMVTRVNRPIVNWYKIFFITALIAALILYLFNTDNQWVFVGFTALLIGFSLYGLHYQVCFINPIGLGQVSRRMEMEIQWDEIESYRWDRNVLQLKLKHSRYLNPRFRFFDTAVVVTVNEYLAQVKDMSGQAVL